MVQHEGMCSFFFDVDLKEIKKKFDIKLKNSLFFINSKLPGASNCIHIHSCATPTFLNFNI